MDPAAQMVSVGLPSLGFASLHPQKLLSPCPHQDSRLIGPLDLKFQDKESILSDLSIRNLSLLPQRRPCAQILISHYGLRDLK